MDDIEKNKVCKLNDKVIHSSIQDLAKEIKETKLNIYDIGYIIDEHKSIIFNCVNVETNECISYVIDNVKNIYDTIGTMYYATKYGLWNTYSLHGYLGYKFISNVKRCDLFEDNSYEIINNLPLKENDIYHFSFSVDKNTDILQTGEDAKGFCKVSYQEDVKDIKIIINNYMNDVSCINGNSLKEVAETVPCKEKPYKVFIYGVDDSSYTKTYKTLEEVEKVVITLQLFDKIYIKKFIQEYGFVFTN